MKSFSRYTFVGLILLIMYVPFGASQSFDYHREEAGSVSWNGTYNYDARLVAMGGVSLLASPSFAGIENPSLMLIPEEGNHILAGITLFNQGSSAYQYGVLNLGVLWGESISESETDLGGVAVLVKAGDLVFAAGQFKNNSFNLPDYYYSEQSYSIRGTYSGDESSYYLASAISPIRDIVLGLKLSIYSGHRENILDEIYDRVILIKQAEISDLNYYSITAGASWNVSDRFKIAGSMNLPFGGDIETRLVRSFRSPATNIEDIQNSTDDLYRPFSGRIGFLYSFCSNEAEPRLILGAEVIYSAWSDYKYISFGEELPRDTEDTLILALGAEYIIRLKYFDLLFRGGYRLDPQPLKEPAVTLNHISGGIGIKFGKLSVDIAGSYITGTMERWNPEMYQFLLTLSYRIPF